MWYIVSLLLPILPQGLNSPYWVYQPGVYAPGWYYLTHSLSSGLFCLNTLLVLVPVLLLSMIVA